MDAHYTPKPMAETLLGHLTDLRPQLIADLSAGDGDLLFEAERHWPTAIYLATDISSESTRRLARLRPAWRVARCDLRSTRSRKDCAPLEGARGQISLLLLNPPFTCIGAQRFAVQTVAGTLTASTAMSFLLSAAEYISPQGEIAAILPLGSLFNSKDTPAWNYLKERYSVQFLDRNSKGAFPDSAASTQMVRLSPKRSALITESSSAAPIDRRRLLTVTAVRGSCQIHLLTPEPHAPRLIHYTDLKDGSISRSSRLGYGRHKRVTGPAVLIPRVGRITQDKVCLLTSKRSVMLSDCVIALKASSLPDAQSVRQRILSDFSAFSANYVGTGAPFITLSRLTSFLSAIGIVASV